MQKEIKIVLDTERPFSDAIVVHNFANSIVAASLGIDVLKSLIEASYMEGSCDGL